MKLGKFHIGRLPHARFGVRWLTTRDEGQTLVLAYRSIPAEPPAYGRTLAITPEAVAGSPGVLLDAAVRVVRNAIDTDSALRRQGKRGINFRTLTLVAVQPTKEPDAPEPERPSNDESHYLLTWKALGR